MASIDDEEVDVDVLWNLDEEWMLGEGGSESHPRVEEVGTPNSGCSHDPVAGLLCCREGGKRVLKRVRRCASDRS